MASSVGEVSLDVLGDLSGFRESVTRQLAAIRLPEVRITATADLTRLRREIDRVRATRLAPLVLKVELDAAEALAQLRLLQSESLDPLSLRIDLDSAQAMMELARLRTMRLDPINLPVEAETQQARMELEGLRTAGPSSIDIDVDVDTAGAMAGISSLGFALMGLSVGLPVIGALAGGLVTLGAAATAAGAGVGAFAMVAVPAISRVSEALQAQEQAQASESQQAGQAQSQAMALAGARRTLASAVRNAAYSHQSALDGVRNAENQLAQAQRAAVQAQQAIGQARADARRSLDNMQNSLINAGLALRSDELAVQRAKQNLDALNASRQDALDLRKAEMGLAQAQQKLSNLASSRKEELAVQKAQLSLTKAQQAQAKTGADPKASQGDRDQAQLAVDAAKESLRAAQEQHRAKAMEIEQAKLAVDAAKEALRVSREQRQAKELERKEAQLAYDQAIQQLKDQRRAIKQLQADEAKARQAGVEGSDQVRAARERLAAANQRVTESERNVQKARQEVSRVDQQAADAVASARATLAQATQQTVTSNTQLQQSLAELSPAERALMTDVVGLKNAFSDWQRAMQPTVLPLLSRGIALLRSQIPSLTPFVQGATAGLDQLLKRVSAGARGQEFAQFKAQLAQLSGPATASIGNSVINVVAGIGRLFNAFMPYAPQMLGFIERLTAKFSTWAASLSAGGSNSGGFQRFMTSVAQVAPKVQEALSKVAEAVGHVVSSLSEAGLSGLTVLGAVADLVSRLSPEQIQLIAGALIACKLAIMAVRAATMLWAGAQAILNFALGANPIGLIVLTIAALVAAVVAAYRNVDWFRKGVDKAWAGIKTAISFAWNRVIKPVFEALKNYVVKILIPQLKMLWDVAKKVWSGIATAAKWAWNNVIKPIWNALKKYIQDVLAPTFRWIYDKIIKPVFAHIGQHIRQVWNTIIKPAFDAIKRALGLVGTAFSRGASAIRSAWTKIQDYAKKPINFVIGTVYNKGIVGLWNKVMGWLHLPKSLQLGTMPLLASGGELSSVQPMKTNRPKAIVGEGNPRYPEYVIPTDPKFRGRASALWAAAGGDMQLLAKGGILGGLLDKVKNGAGKLMDLGKDALSFVTDPKKVFDKLASPVLDKAKGLATSPWGQAAAAMPKQLLGQVWAAAKQLVGAFSEGYGGSGDANAVVQAAASQLGIPYSWGGGGPNGPSLGFGRGAGTVGFDCSSLMQYAYWKGARTSLPRVTYDQMEVGRPVRGQSELRPGDLVFTHPGHVMMAANNGAKGAKGMIEAQRTGTNVMYSPFRGMAAGARRILSNIPAAKGGMSGATGQAMATYYWDGHIPTASGRQMSADTIASPTWPLGTKVMMAVNGRNVTGTVWDFGPADWVVNRNGNKQMIDLATPLSAKLFGGRPNNGIIQYKILSKGTGRSYLGRRPQWGSQLSGFEKGGIAPGNSWGVVGEAGPELVRFNRSTQVIDHDTSKQLTGGPGIGVLNVHVPEKATVEQVVHEIEFSLKKSRKGGVYAGV